MEPYIVDVEEIFAIQERRKKINSIPMDRLALCYQGREIEMDRAGIQDWVFSGLTNFDFVISYEKDIKERLSAGKIRYK